MDRVAEYLNIGAYRFVSLPEPELENLRQNLKTRCDERSFRGTILLSVEGINLNLVGRPDAIREFQDWLAGDSRFEDLSWKESFSHHLPYNRMLVKIKAEIIAFGQDGIDPSRRTAPYVRPRELKRWLDEQRDVILLDTRNLYEIHLGTFRGARHLDIQTFRALPARVRDLSEEEREGCVVTFCTGGIRCEKAASLLQREGFKDVYQLEGGILKYFEECGGEHFDGECFVYDRRVALNSDLDETETVQCFNCMMPVTAEEQELSGYVPDVSCPHCVNGKPTKE